MEATKVRPFEQRDEGAVADLWRHCHLHHPGNDPHDMMLRKTAFQPDLFLVGESEERVVATVMAGYEGRRGWVDLPAVEPELRKRGIGWPRPRSGSGTPKPSPSTSASATPSIPFSASEDASDRDKACQDS